MAHAGSDRTSVGRPGWRVRIAVLLLSAAVVAAGFVLSGLQADDLFPDDPFAEVPALEAADEPAEGPEQPTNPEQPAVAEQPAAVVVGPEDHLAPPESPPPVVALSL